MLIMTPPIILFSFVQKGRQTRITKRVKPPITKSSWGSAVKFEITNSSSKDKVSILPSFINFITPYIIPHSIKKIRLTI